jgi:hypothetical protein
MPSQIDLNLHPLALPPTAKAPKISRANVTQPTSTAMSDATPHANIGEFLSRNALPAVAPETASAQRLSLGRPCQSFGSSRKRIFVTVLDPKAAFCTLESCTVVENGVPYFRDQTHLTNEGSAFLISRLGRQLLEALKP